MLKRLYIDNFRCFVNFEYKPERKQLLLGANGSGKSSLLDAVRAVQGFVREDGGRDFNRSVFQDSKTRWLELPQQVFEIEVELEGRSYVYRLEINSESNPKNLVLAESLRVDGNPILEYSNGYVFLFPSDASGPLAPFMVEEAHTSMLGFLKDSHKEAKRFFVWLSKDLNCFRIDPYAMKNVGKFTGSVLPAFNLSNIADWYMNLTLHDSHGIFQLRSSLQETLDGLASLNFRSTETGYADFFASFNRPKDILTFRLMELSEGQRCLLALYMILHFLIAKGCTVFLDEPENFISLREIQPWLLAAEAAVDDSKGQLILISHHPEILNQWAQEDGLRFFREENGHVRTEKFKSDYDGLLSPSEVVARGWENDERSGQ